MRVLFSNAPWHKVAQKGHEGWRGVKAGSRWPHALPYYGGSLIDNYVPFPFFLATACALAKQEGFDAAVRDSIALGETYEEFYNFIVDFAPDLIVMETTTPSLSNDLIIAKQIKVLLKDITIVFTGIHYELEQESFLRSHPVIDYVVYGEYEISVNELLKALSLEKEVHSISNLVYRNGETAISKTPFGKLADLNKLPWPERDGLPYKSYYDSVCGLDRPQLQIHTTRGCPFGCIFCVWPQVVYRGRDHRLRDPEDVVDELVANLAKHPYKSFYIDDDTFNVNSKHVLEIARLIKERGLGSIPWGMMGRADLMTEEILLKLKEAGLYSVKYGVESASQEVLDEIDKQINLEQVKKMVNFSKKIGLKVHLTFTFGLPSDTAESIEETIALACDLPTDLIQFSIATPFPGTKMYEIYEKKGWITTKNWDCYNGASKAVSRTDQFTGEQLEGFVQEAYRRWADSLIERALGNDEFKVNFKKKMAAEAPQCSRILVLQCATFALTKKVVSLLNEMSYEVHVLLHERFMNKFSTLILPERLHTFDNVGNFEYNSLYGFSEELARRYKFSGAVVPYSNPSGWGYEEVERIAALAGGRIIAGIGNDGTIIK